MDSFHLLALQSNRPSKDELLKTEIIPTKKLMSYFFTRIYFFLSFKMESRHWTVVLLWAVHLEALKI